MGFERRFKGCCLRWVGFVIGGGGGLCVVVDLSGSSWWDLSFFFLF